MVGLMREGIWCGELSARNVNEFKVEVCEVKELAGLSLVERLGQMEEGEVFMVCENLHWKRGPMEIMSPCL